MTTTLNIVGKFSVEKVEDLNERSYVQSITSYRRF